MHIKSITDWIDNNQDQFVFSPIMKRRTNDCLEIEFRGLNPRIATHIHSYGGMEIAVRYQDCVWDLITDFDISPTESAGGKHYCSSCESPTYYDSEISLWEAHSLTKWTQWLKRLAVTRPDLEIRSSPDGGCREVLCVASGSTDFTDKWIIAVEAVVVGSDAPFNDRANNRSG